MSFSGEQWDAAPRRIVFEQAQRFHAGWRLVDTLRAVIVDPDDVGAPDLTVDVIRPRDLVALTVRFYGAKLTSTGAGVNGDLPFVERKGSGAHVMVVEFPFQHAHEEAQYVTETGVSGVPNELGPDKPGLPPADTTPPGVDDSEPPDVPVGFRPARRSRLVFAIGPSDRIEFTREGILRAIRELTPVLHPNAAPPGVRGSIDTSTNSGRLVWITPDLIARYTGEEIVLAAPTAADRKATPPPDPNSVTGALQFSESLRALRTDSANLTVRAEGRAAVGRVPNVIRDIIQRGPILGPIDFPKYSSSPTPHQTAIEAPYRLLISPSSEGRWTHADTPVPADDTPRHVELWHSRLAVTGPGDVVTERDASRRIVRAIWTRDRDGLPAAEWRAIEGPGHPLSTPKPTEDLPFRGSLNRADRHRLVRQSAERWTGIKKPESLRPVGVDKLWLSSLGAWLDLHGAWYTKEYSVKGIPSVLAWDHIAPLGRDQWVRVVYPGYLFPFGHACALVKITERRVTANPAVASLYQFKFLVISEPSRTYDGSDNPYVRVDLSPTTTPPIKDPGEKVDTFFVPNVAVPGAPASDPGIPFQFTGDSWDKDNHHENFRTPLFWVAEHFQTFTEVQNAYDASPHRIIPMWGQKVAFAPRTPDGDSITETVTMRWRGRAAVGSSTPYLSSADVVVDAARRLSNVPATTIIYNPTYLDRGPERRQRRPGVGEGAAAGGQDRAAAHDRPRHPDASEDRVRHGQRRLRPLRRLRHAGCAHPRALLADGCRGRCRRHGAAEARPGGVLQGRGPEAVRARRPVGAHRRPRRPDGHAEHRERDDGCRQAAAHGRAAAHRPAA